MQTLPPHGAPHAVVDTNILIRAVLKPTGTDGKVYKMFLAGEILLYFSEEQLQELQRTLNYPRIKKKYKVTDDTIDTFVQTIFTYGKLVYPTQRVELCRDPDDNELLSIAKSILHDEQIYLITGDKDLLVLKGKVEGLDILTPQEFLRKAVRLPGR